MATSIHQPSVAQVLTVTPTASTNTAVVEGMCGHTLDLEWTPGVTGNILTVLIQHRNNGVTDGQWTQEMVWKENPAGTLTRTLMQLVHTSVSTAVVPLSFFFQGHYGEVRLIVSEDSSGGAGKGTLATTLTSSTQT